MLPGIDTENRADLADDGVLVGIRLDANAASLHVLNQPCPATALNASKGCVELLLEGVEAAVAVVDGLGEGSRRRLTTALRLRSQVLPKEGVVNVSTCAGELARCLKPRFCSANPLGAPDTSVLYSPPWKLISGLRLI